jgi:hypothetical protein
MHIVDKGFVQDTQYIISLRGASQPFLAQASDGLLSLVEFTQNPKGQTCPFTRAQDRALSRMWVARSILEASGSVTDR